MANYLRDAIRYQQEMEEANRPVTVNSLMARKAAAIKQNAPAENMLTQYAQTMPQNWQQFGQNMAQAYPTPATGASREQILGAVTQAAMNAGPLMTVYHGSPHRFDKFDASKIGTGEGAQAYGHGLYLAENPVVAKGYAKKLSTFDEGLFGPIMRKHDIPGDIAPEMNNVDFAKRLLSEYGNKLNAAEKQALQDSVKSNLYKVDLPDEQIAKMLDWDKPLTTTPNGRAALDGLMPKLDKESAQLLKQDAARLDGSGLVTWAQRVYGKDGASAYLQSHGIPGIRYLDEGSRAAGEGTSNFVVFPGNEGLLKILERQ